jgi:hypothetical protein
VAKPFFHLRKLTMTRFARDKGILLGMLAKDSQPIQITKWGGTIAIVITPDHYLSLLSNQKLGAEVTEILVKVEKQMPSAKKPFAPFQ